jgi:hypothetical protein
MAGPVTDRLGRPILAGDRLMVDNARCPIVKVIAVKPQMDPSGPAGHIVEAVAGYQFFVPAGRQLMDCVLCAAGEDEAGSEDEAGEPVATDGPRLVES